MYLSYLIKPYFFVYFNCFRTMELKFKKLQKSKRREILWFNTK